MVLEEQPVRTPIGPESSVLVVGASRGLGLEFCRQLGSRGATVYATYRGEQAPSALAALVTANPGRVHALPLDVCDDASVEAALARIVKLAKTARPLSHVIHNSGVYGSTSGLGNLKREQMMHTFEVNAVGPVVVAQRAKALLRLPKKAETAVYALLSSKMGSIDDNGSGGSYGYRMSKSALVIVSKSLSIDLRGTAGVVCLHPGYVRTDMTGGAGLIDVAESVRGMLRAIEATDGATPFRWVDYKAEIVPY